MEMYKPDQDKIKVFWSTLQNVWLQLYGSAFPTAAAINVRLIPLMKMIIILVLTLISFAT